MQNRTTTADLLSSALPIGNTMLPAALSTEDGNELIAKFLGWKKGDTWQVVNSCRDYVSKNDLKFDTDWQWLMQPVCKIKDFGFVIAFEICFSLGTIVKVFYDGTWHCYESNNEKEAVWLACIEFINWYNSLPVSQR